MHSPASRTPQISAETAQPRSLFFFQWDFRLGSAAAGGKASGPLGGVGSGPQVEKMVEAMDSWNGLCLDYRYSTLIGASTVRPISKHMEESARFVGGKLCLNQPSLFPAFSTSTAAGQEYHVRCQSKKFNREEPPCILLRG